MTVAELKDAMEIIDLRDSMKKELEEIRTMKGNYTGKHPIYLIGLITLNKADLNFIIDGRQRQIDTLTDALIKIGIKE